MENSTSPRKSLLTKPIDIIIAAIIYQAVAKGTGSSSFTEYEIKLVRANSTFTIIAKRYREFLALHNNLVALHGSYNKSLASFDFPKKVVSKMKTSVIEDRKIALQKYLDFLLADPVLGTSPQVRDFLQLHEPILKRYYSDFIEPRRKYNLRLVQYNLVDFMSNITHALVTSPRQKREIGAMSDETDIRCLFPVTFHGTQQRIATGGSHRIIPSDIKRHKFGVIGPAGIDGMYGQSGHDGNKLGWSNAVGLPGNPGSDGTNGQPARSLSVVLDIKGKNDDSIDILVEDKNSKAHHYDQNETQFGAVKAFRLDKSSILEVFSTGGQGGNGGKGGMGGVGGTGARGENGQDGAPGTADWPNGEDGEDGGPGEDGSAGGDGGLGGNGGNGGRGGDITIYARDTLAFLVTSVQAKGGVAGEGGHGGEGGRGGLGGRGGAGGRGGRGYIVPGDDFNSGSDGNDGAPGSNGRDGRNGKRGANGMPGKEGLPGVVTFCLLDVDGKVVEQGNSVFNVTVVDLEVNDGNDDGYLSFGDTLTLTKVIVCNTGSLTLPPGAELRCSFNDSFNEFILSEIPQLAPQERFEIKPTVAITLPVLSVTNPGVQMSKCHVVFNSSLHGRVLATSGQVASINYTWPLTFRTTHLLRMSDGETKQLSVEITNKTAKEIGPEYQLAWKLPVGLMCPDAFPVSHENGFKVWEIKVGKVPPHSTRTIHLNLKLEDVACTYEKMTHQIELHLGDRMIQYEHSEVQKIPSWHSYLEGADDADVVLFVDENTKPEDFVSWSQLFSALDVRCFIWDCFQEEIGAFTPWADHVKIRRALWVNVSAGQLHPADITRHFSIEAQNDIGGVITHVMNVHQVCTVGAEVVPNINFGRAESKAPAQFRALKRAEEILQEVSKDSPFIHFVDTYTFNPVKTDSKFFSYGTLEILKLKWKPNYKWFVMQSLPQFSSQDKLWSGMSNTIDANHRNIIFMVVEGLPVMKKLKLLSHVPILPCHEWEFPFTLDSTTVTVTFAELVIVSIANECMRESKNSESVSVYWQLLELLKAQPTLAKSVFIGAGISFAIMQRDVTCKPVKQWSALKKSLNAALFESKQQKKVCEAERTKLYHKLSSVQPALQTTFQHFYNLLEPQRRLQ